MKHVVLVSHGTDSLEGSKAITELANAVASALPDVAVTQAYVDVQKPELGEVLGELIESDSAAEITVIPLFLGAGYHVKNDISRAIIGAAQGFSNADKQSIELAAALNNPQLVAQMALAKLAPLNPGAGDIVVFTTAGSSDLAAQVKARSNFEHFRAAVAEHYPGTKTELAFLSAAQPLLKDLVPKLKFTNPRARVLVSTHLLATGFFHRLAGSAGAHLVSGPWLEVGVDIPEPLVKTVVGLAGSTGARLGCAKSADTSGASADFKACAEGCLAPCSA